MPFGVPGLSFKDTNTLVNVSENSGYIDFSAMPLSTETTYIGLKETTYIGLKIFVIVCYASVYRAACETNAQTSVR